MISFSGSRTYHAPVTRLRERSPLFLFINRPFRSIFHLALWIFSAGPTPNVSPTPNVCLTPNVCPTPNVCLTPNVYLTPNVCSTPIVCESPKFSRIDSICFDRKFQIGRPNMCKVESRWDSLKRGITL